jgi:hypothetical protein
MLVRSLLEFGPFASKKVLNLRIGRSEPELKKRFKHRAHRGHREKRRERKEIFLLFEEEIFILLCALRELCVSSRS